MEYFFKARALTVGYNGRPLIRDINIALQRGQILTLIGPNGSGKSTILKSIARQLKPLDGEVHIRGRRVCELSDRELSFALAAQFTDRLRTELMTCEDVVAVGRYPYTGALGILSGEDRKKVHEALELMDALDLRDKDFMEISDGQRQRILLARAVCQEPRVIVLDEPTSYLDIKYTLELLRLLKALASERGITIIMSLHQLDMARKVSDILMCVKGETVSKIGSPQEVFTRENICELFDLSEENYKLLFEAAAF